jgi:hypothetical protein
MEKRRVILPESIKATNTLGQPIKDSATGKQLVLVASEIYDGKLRDAWFFQGSDGTLTIVSLRPRFKKAKPGDALDIDEDEWNLMCLAIKHPKSPPDPRYTHVLYEIAEHMVIFNSAWLDAEKVNVSDDEKGSAAKVVRQVTRSGKK